MPGYPELDPVNNKSAKGYEPRVGVSLRRQISAASVSVHRVVIGIPSKGTATLVQVVNSINGADGQ
jgi:hypothetical protein